MKITLLAFLLISTASFCYAQDYTYVTSRLTGSPPALDGLLEDEAWKTAHWESIRFTQLQPYENKPASQNTSFAILFDDNNLYVAIRAEDSAADKINRQLLRRDNEAADWVGIAIDSYEDKLTGFSFAVTASGTKLDNVIVNDNTNDYSWDPIWYVKTKIDSKGWSAEMRIPLSQLRFTKKQQYHWGLEIARFIYRSKELSLWKPLQRNSSKVVSNFGTLEGISDISPKKDIELFPFAVGKLTLMEKEEGNPFKTGRKIGGTAGLDSKISLTNDITMNVTINPDFGQVEADPSEVNLSAYESYFSEKRPFFIEGRNIFNFPLSSGDGEQSRIGMFYSRRLGRAPHFSPDLNDNQFADEPIKTNILGAVKISGKTKKGTSVGFLETVTSKEYAHIDTEGERTIYASEPLTNYVVARVEQDIDKGNTILGGIFTSANRRIDDPNFSTLASSAYTGGLNFVKYWDNKNYFFGARGIFSGIYGSHEAITDLQTSSTHNFQRRDALNYKVDSSATRLLGSGGTLEMGKFGGEHWMFLTWLTYRSPGLDFNDAGFMPNADEIQQVLWVGYRETKPKSFYNQYQINVSTYNGWNFDGIYIYRGLAFNSNITFKNFYSAWCGLERQGESYTTADLRGGPALRLPPLTRIFGGFETDDRKKFIFNADVHSNISDEHNFRYLYAGTGITYKPFNTLSVQIGCDFNGNTDNLQYVETIENDAENKYLTAHLSSKSIGVSGRVDVSLTPDLSIQFYGQPFLFSGKYERFKFMTDTRSENYTERFHELSSNEIEFNAGNDQYLIDSNGDGNKEYTLDNPDFHFIQYRSNLVFRWEYKPGSTLFLVWAQGRTNDGPDGDFRFNDYSQELVDTKPENDFLFKVSYALVF